jgi:hypothetical protein
MNFLGIDPDMHHLGMAIVDEHFHIVRVFTIKNRGPGPKDAVPSGYEAVILMAKKLSEIVKQSPITNPLHPAYAPVAAAVEGQQVYGKGPTNKTDPNDLKNLATVTGFSLMACLGAVPEVYVPLPAEWKGQVKKRASQKLILEKAGVLAYFHEAGSDTNQSAGYMALNDDAPGDLIPGSEAILSGQWRHVNDAVGLAQYASRTYQEGVVKAKLLAEAQERRRIMSERVS